HGRERHVCGTPRWLLSSSGYAAHAGDGWHDGVPWYYPRYCPDVGDGTEHVQRDHRPDDCLYAPPGPGAPQPHALPTRDAVCGGRARARHVPPARPGAPYPSRLSLPPDCPRYLPLRRGGIGGGVPLLSRGRHTALHPELGQHAGGVPRLPAGCALDHAVSWTEPDSNGVSPEPRRRWHP